MATTARPIFQNGERLTAQRLNEAVDFCLTSLRRALLAPLSAGVAIGLELEREATSVGGQPTTALVRPGVAIDGLGRVLVLTRELLFTAAEIRAQIRDLAAGDRIRVSLGAGRGDRTIADPCAPVPGCALEHVELFFERLSPLFAEVFPSTVTIAGVAPSVTPSAELIDPAVSPAFYAVPLGSVICQAGGYMTVSTDERAGVRPTFSTIRNSYGDDSIRLDRVGDAATVAVLVPMTFNAAVGGPLAQAAVLAASVGAPPAGRPSPADPTVLEAAGGPGAGSIPGTSGVVAISMQYDVATGRQNGGFAQVPAAGFPLVLSPAATTAPMVAPPTSAAPLAGVPLLVDAGPHSVTPHPVIGLSAGASYLDPSDPTGTRQLVPVATAGLISAWVDVTAAVPVGTALTVAAAATSGQWGLTVVGSGGGLVVAQAALPLTPATLPGLQRTWVWVASPYHAHGSGPPSVP